MLFQTGLQVLDGETALWFVRSRHADSDFGRNRRQRQFLLAVRQQALQLNMITKAPAMLSSIMDSVKTDLRTTEILSLARMAKDVETSKLVSRAVDESMVNPWMTPGGAAVLLPEPAAIRQVVQEVFGTPGKLPTLPVMRAPPVVSTPDVLSAPIAVNPVSSTPGGATATPMDLPGSRSGSFFITPSVVPTRVPASVTPVNLLRGPSTVTPVSSGGAVTGMHRSGDGRYFQCGHAEPRWWGGGTTNGRGDPSSWSHKCPGGFDARADGCANHRAEFGGDPGGCCSDRDRAGTSGANRECPTDRRAPVANTGVTLASSHAGSLPEAGRVRPMFRRQSAKRRERTAPGRRAPSRGQCAPVLGHAEQSRLQLRRYLPR
ncbi:MAG: LytR family transcriptional regulator [Proteobacteria bacterium]|nr:LytR family transcriptional regulator [Pseudomonadota bacterium]